jgi:UDP-2,3-diacylglucosamine pyrophosphatase LpxH
LDYRTSPITGRTVLHFPYMAFSDSHWGSPLYEGKSAMRCCRMLRDIESDELKGLGDLVGGTELRDKPSAYFDPWQAQAVARFLQKADYCRVTALRGNHEEGLERWVEKPKNLFGIDFRVMSEHRDPKGRLFLEEHGDRYDMHVFKTPENQAMWYTIGDRAMTMGGNIDYVMQNGLGLEEASVVAFAKHQWKDRFNRWTGIIGVMEDTIDRSHYDGNVSGHSHIKGFHRTPGGKLLINDGSVGEKAYCAVHDRHGNWGIIRYGRHGMKVEMENGHKYRKTWAELGLKHFADDPVPLADDNVYMQRFGRIKRFAFNMWPARDQQALRENIHRNGQAVERLLDVLSVGVPQPHVPQQAYRDMFRAEKDTEAAWRLRRALAPPRCVRAGPVLPARPPSELVQ